jgi:hypothetical protein
MHIYVQMQLILHYSSCSKRIMFSFGLATTNKYYLRSFLLVCIQPTEYFFDGIQPTEYFFDTDVL